MKAIGAVSMISSLAATGPVYRAVTLKASEVLAAIYRQVKAAHPGAVDDLIARFSADDGTTDGEATSKALT